MWILSNIRVFGRRAILSSFLLTVLCSFCITASPSERTGKDIKSSISYDRWFYYITASAGPGGSISPSGQVWVWRNANKKFEISANTGYEILDVEVDGKSIGAVASYTFEKVNADHTISATFARKRYTITAVAGTGGSIVPSGKVSVFHGDDQSFTVDADQGYEILDVLIDNISAGPLDNYTFESVTADHTITASFNSTFGILNLTIPDESMKIGDTVAVDIIVVHDAGTTCSLVSGSVGGYPLEGFHRISENLYGASFTIVEGGNSYTASQDIPVSNVIISDGEQQSTPYELPIVLDNDPLDAALPLISSMQVTGGTKKIGDEVLLYISADGSSYRLHPSSTINGIAATEPNIAFDESGGGNYILTYTVQEGDPDVVPGSSELQASIMLVKPSGNTGIPYTDIANASGLSIDANAPEVIRMEVPSMEVGVGGTVVLKVLADGTGYSAGSETTINGIPISSARVSFTMLTEGMYELSYVVGTDDHAVAPGMLNANVVLVDAAGNEGEFFSTIEPNDLEIYTDLPEAVLYGPSQICDGEEAELTVLLVGRSPWSFELNNGTSSTSYTNITTYEYTIRVKPVETTTYQIISVTDVNGVENTGAESLPIKVNEKTFVEIVNLAVGYFVDDEPVKLEANLPGGTFSGPGVVSATGTFYPNIADTVDSPHIIYYTYENASGCISIASKMVYVYGTTGVIVMPDDIVCANGEPFIVTVLNIPGVTGSFRLMDSDSQPVPGLTDHGDNTATIDPSLLSLGNYTIEYQYFKGETLYLNKAFSVESVVRPMILSLDETGYCQNIAPFVLQADLEKVVFEGPGVTGDIDNGYIFAPHNIEPGNITITATHISEIGCTASTEESVEVLPAPELKFGVVTSCDSLVGEIASFDNQTRDSSLVETWNWDFGDPASGQHNQSNLISPSHYYTDPGQFTVSLAATTFEGCTSTSEKDITIDSQPVADFTWMSDCSNNDSEVIFINRSTSGSSSFDTIIWTFKTKDGEILGQLGTGSTEDTVSFAFGAVDSFRVDLFTMNQGGCTSEITKEIVLRPTIRLSGEGYAEDFNRSEGMWTIHSQDQAESWQWGVPDFNGYTPLPEDKAWFTRLPDGANGYLENSWIQSPCFDFSGMDRPMIELDVMKSFVPNLNGAVLQYRDMVEQGWKTVGEHTPGIGWYNIHDILHKPGGSSMGWGLDEFDPDREWVTAIHDLDQLAGKPSVALRIAIATNGRHYIGNQGFAFDNITITERSRLAILEHFTNSSDDTSAMADHFIDDLKNRFSKDIIDLQYHVDYIDVDPMNENNPNPPSTRSFHYGVPKVPYAVLNGGMNLYHRYEYDDMKSCLIEDHLRMLTLENPVFDIDLAVDWRGSDLESTISVTCLTERFEENVQLYVAVLETSVTAYTGGNGDTQFRNVVLEMLPTPAGKLLGDKWLQGMQEVRSYSWTYEPYVEDIEDLAVVAFLQDRSTNRVLQASVVYKDPMVGVVDPDAEITGLFTYPNPSHSMIHVNLGARTDNSGTLEIIDLTGKMVLIKEVPPGYQIIQLEIEHLQKGVYLLRWSEANQVKGVSKVVKYR